MKAMRRAGTLGLAVAVLSLGAGCEKDAQRAKGGATPAGGGRAAIQFPVEVAPVE